MTITLSAAPTKQNAHLTFKQNSHYGRHGWLRLTPAYSVGLVTEILSGIKSNAKIVDPFSGTGTTALCSAYLGLNGTGLEINPFLFWLSSVKSRHFSPDVLEKTNYTAAKISNDILQNNALKCSPPPIHHIERWWDAKELEFLCKLKLLIQDLSISGTDERDLLLVAFCRTLMKLSNASFNHQSISFKKKDNGPVLFDLSIPGNHSDLFLSEMRTILSSAADNPLITPKIYFGDARNPEEYLHEKYDILITSPPYPNRISYIRELRPYMYWLDFLKTGRDAGEYDWEAIGGTWGIATSRLASWSSSFENNYRPSILKRVVDKITAPSNPNGNLLGRYVEKYFDDIWQHISSIRKVLNNKAEVHYIVGNSTFYGTLLPVEEIYKDMLEESGFKDVKIYKIRKRNSKAELFEYNVTGKI